MKVCDKLQVGASRLDVWSDGWSRRVEGGASGVGSGVVGVEAGGSETDRGIEGESVDEKIVTTVQTPRMNNKRASTRNPPSVRTNRSAGNGSEEIEMEVIDRL
jgi:hypothetical protein